MCSAAHMCTELEMGNPDSPFNFNLSDVNGNASAEELDPTALLNLSSALQGQSSRTSPDFFLNFVGGSAEDGDAPFTFNIGNDVDDSDGNDNSEEPLKFFGF
ncbi:hypothetical protein Tcan_10743 [Toxocara canis]|uniref:Uncharacterized protein n=1 Tax=Toxocara canis TaxID=6265 RepID=A0A0B2VEI8_TOXCA|nr:hypothetical protein Tcan_10743 [Toxocara canis]